MIKEALYKTHKARIYILDEIMLKAIEKPREELSKYAPKLVNLTITEDKIRDVIGSGGKVIQKICADCDVKVDIQEDGRVFISSTEPEGARKAKEIIENITRDIEVGGIYTGKVTRIATFGAFIELAENKEGLLHISKISKERVNKVEDVFKVGDEVTVKVYEIDEQGRINLTRKDLYTDEQE